MVPENNVEAGEKASIYVLTTSNLQPVEADIQLKINDEQVASAKGPEYTYQLQTTYIGTYKIDVIASYNNGINSATSRRTETIVATGELSKALYLASSLGLSALSEVYDSKDLATSSLVSAFATTGETAVSIFTGWLGGELTDFLKPYYPSFRISELTGDIINFISYGYTYHQQLIDQGYDAQYVANWVKSELNNGWSDWPPINRDESKINSDSEDFVKYIRNHKQKFIDYPQIDDKFKLQSEAIESTVETHAVFAPSLFGDVPIYFTTEKNMRDYFVLVQGCGDFLSTTLSTTSIACTTICIIATASAYITGGASLAVSAYFGAWGVMFGKAADFVGIIESCKMLNLATSMIMMVPPVVNAVDIQHENSILILEGAKTGFDECIQKMLSYINTTNNIDPNSNELNTNSFAFVVTPDGKIYQSINDNCYLNLNRAGNYSVYAYTDEINSYYKSKSTHFQVSKPNITLNISYTLHNKDATIDLSIENHELNKLDNVMARLNMRDASNEVFFSKFEILSLNAGEIKDLSYKVDLVTPEIYTATASLSISSSDSIKDKTILIPLGVQTIEDAAILDVKYQNEYSPYSNITMNITLKSYIPELALNISIPKLNYSMPATLSGTDVINLTLPKLLPDYYTLGILIEKDGKILDSRIISFYVRADGVGLITFNTSRLVYTAGEPILINLSLKDLNLSNIDASVGVIIKDPIGGEHDYIATKTPEGYQFTFVPAINGTYILETHATKEGYRISNTTLTVIVGQMSPLEIDVTNGDKIKANILANNAPAACKLTIYTDQGNISVMTPNGVAIFNPEDSFYLVADKMFFEPATFSYIKNGIVVETSANPSSSAPGGHVNFAIKISNTGNYSFNQVSAMVYLSPGLNYLFDSANGSSSGRIISWNNLGPLPVGESIAILLGARIDEGATGSLKNTINVTGIAPLGEADKVGSGASAESIVNVLVPGVKVEKTLGIREPIQYGEFCENRRVTGTGKVDISTSVVDKEIALKYQNRMAGNGNIEIESENAFSESAGKLQRQIGNNTTSLNLYENSKMTYSGETPLSGEKYLESKEFYGGIGARIQEAFSVNEMEKDQQTFFASTDPTCNEVDHNKSDQLRNASSTHLVALETKNTFNGTWGTDASWYKIFYKDIKAHEMFTGTFEADKLIKFHENPVSEKEHNGCEDIDC